MNTAAKGRKCDRKTIEYLASLGATDWMVSAASKGHFDLIAWSSEGTIFVQTKATKVRQGGSVQSFVPTAELLGLLRAKVPENALKLICIWRNYSRQPEVWEVGKEITKLFCATAEERIRNILCQAQERKSGS